MFVIDALYLLIQSTYYIIKKNTLEKLPYIEEGPTLIRNSQLEILPEKERVISYMNRKET